jgi:hypothetical protein
MKRSALICLLSAASVLMATAEVIEKWTFDYPDDTPLSQTLSDQGTPLATVDKPTARIWGNRLELNAEGDNDSIFLINEFSGPALPRGIYEVEWSYMSTDFARTHEAKGRAVVGFDLRDTRGTRYKGKDDVVLGGVRMHFNKTDILIEYQDATSEKYIEIAKVERVLMLEPLHVRIRFDLDQSGQAGSMQVFLRLGDQPEINPLIDGMIPEGVQLSGYRLIQQISNGGTAWQKGDYVTVDSFTLSHPVVD